MLRWPGPSVLPPGEMATEQLQQACGVGEGARSRSLPEELTPGMEHLREG